jgi:hypothetical protein
MHGTNSVGGLEGFAMCWPRNGSMVRYKSPHMACGPSLPLCSRPLFYSRVHVQQTTSSLLVTMLEQIVDSVSLMLSEQHRLRLVLLLTSLLVITFVVRRLRRWQRLRHIPGPPLAGFSRWFWLVPMARSGELPERARQVESKYGKGIFIRLPTARDQSCPSLTPLP